MAELKSYPEVGKWLTGKSKGTINNYISAIDTYVEFTGLNPTQLIDEIEADREKKVRERGVPEQRVLGFKEWLLTKYQQKTRGRRDRPKKRRDKFGVSESLANMYCMAVKSFYKGNGFPVVVKLGKVSVKKENFKVIVRGPEISKLLSVATTLRDKAIVKFMYESTQGVSEVCSPNLGDIAKHEEDGMEVWQFHTIRKKTKTEYFTEIGPEAIELLKTYFEERERSGEKLNKISPVFVKEGRKKKSRQRITPNLIDNTLKSLAIRSGLVTKEQMEIADLNPLRPHALRAGGMSVLKLTGYNEEAVEFRCGHELSPTRQAYWLTRPDELRKLFREHYDSLRVKGTTPFDIQEVKKLRDMLAEKEITVQALAENGKLKVIELQRLRKELDHQRVMIEGLSKTMNELNTFLENKVTEITRKYLEKWMNEYTKELEEARAEFTRRYREELKEKE